MEKASKLNFRIFAGAEFRCVGIDSEVSIDGINLAVIAQVCTQLRDFVYNRKHFWRDTVASVDYRKLNSAVVQTLKN